MAKHSVLTAARLREVLDYNPEIGQFRWVRGKGRRDRVGYTNRYVLIGVDHQGYLAHRLAWLWMTGHWPTDEIDHINRNPLDNRWENLRCVTRKQNSRNHGLYKHNTSGVNGIFWSTSRRRWKVEICGEFFGWFVTKSEAAQIARKIQARFQAE
jgi:hypothetical protein